MQPQKISISELGFLMFLINIIGPAFLEKSPIAQPNTRISNSFKIAAGSNNRKR